MICYSELVNALFNKNEYGGNMCVDVYDTVLCFFRFVYGQRAYFIIAHGLSL